MRIIAYTKLKKSKDFSLNDLNFFGLLFMKQHNNTVGMLQ